MLTRYVSPRKLALRSRAYIGRQLHVVPEENVEREHEAIAARAALGRLMLQRCSTQSLAAAKAILANALRKALNEVAY